LVQLTGVA